MTKRAAVFRYTAVTMALPVEDIRRQFPFLQKNGTPAPVYLDSAATSQKPQCVLDALTDFYVTSNGNPHRGMHPFAERATQMFEQARETVKEFIHAASPEEVIFTKSTTESINLIARSLGDGMLQAGDAVLVSVLEHHSNTIPWLQLKERMGIELRWIEIDEQGQIDPASLDTQMADDRVKLVAITGLSNVTGTAPDLQTIIKTAHKKNALVLIDAAQMAAHLPIDVQELDCDFLAFSGHKIYGPTGIGVLYGKKKLLATMPPFLGGGMMIREVTRDHFTSADLPAKFEAGTSPVAEAAGLAAAIDWQTQFSWEDRMAHEQALLQLAYKELSSIPNLHILGGPSSSTPITHNSLPITHRHGCISFTIDNIHPHDLTDILGQKNICLRAGHQCAQPLHTHLGITASARLSVSMHTTEEEIRSLKPAILDAMTKLSPRPKT